MEMNVIARKIYPDLDGKLDPAKIADDEVCVVLENPTRVALIKLLGSMSRHSYGEKGLNDREIHALEGMYHLLQ